MLNKKISTESGLYSGVDRGAVQEIVSLLRVKRTPVAKIRKLIFLIEGDKEEERRERKKVFTSILALRSSTTA